MLLPYTAPKWADGIRTKPRPVGLPVFEPPLPNTSEPTVFRQLFEQYRNNWIPCPFNAKHPNYTNGVGSYTGKTYVVVAESQHTDMGGGVIRWHRTYAAIPDSYSEPETFNYTFIGTILATTSPPGVWPALYLRAPISKRVESKITYDFFIVGDTFTPGSDKYGAVIASDLTDDSNASSGGAGTIASPYDFFTTIPFIQATQYALQAYLSGAWYGGLGFTAFQLTGVTQPYATTYQKMVLDAQANGWGATQTVQHFTNLVAGAQTVINPEAGDPVHASPTPNSVYGGIITAEDSITSRWMGNIFVRRTRYVLAQ